MAAEIKINKERLVKIFLELVQISAKSKEEKPVADYIKSFLTNLKLSVTEDDAGPKTNANSGNLVCRIPGTVMSTPAVAVLSHMDTVVPCEGVKPVIRDEVVYSESPTILGADDRAGVAAMLELACILRENPIPHGEVELVFTISEEIGLVGARHLDFKSLHSKLALVLDGHGDPGNVVNAAPTLQSMKVVVHGKAAHAGICPEEGVSAIQIASQAIAQMKLGRVDKETVANIGNINGGLARNIVPDKVEFEAEARSINFEKLKKQMEHMKTCIETTAKKMGGTVDIVIEDGFKGYNIKEDQALLKYVTEASERLKFKPNAEPSGAGTDANILNEHGIPAVVLAIGYKKIHSTHEHIAIKDLISTVRWLIEILWVVNRHAWNQFQTQPLSSAQE